MNPDVKALGKSVDKIDLCILEAIFIKEHNSMINFQFNNLNRILKLFCYISFRLLI